jgi:hypothetical protein
VGIETGPLTPWLAVSHWPRIDDFQANTLTHPADLEAAKHCVELSREIGNSAALRPFAKSEVMPAGLHGAALESFVRDGAVSYWHQSCSSSQRATRSSPSARWASSVRSSAAM